jgi:hypothetical protein
VNLTGVQRGHVPIRLEEPGIAVGLWGWENAREVSAAIQLVFKVAQRSELLNGQLIQCNRVELGLRAVWRCCIVVLMMASRTNDSNTSENDRKTNTVGTTMAPVAVASAHHRSRP